jgi:hypothetical protein
VWLSVHHSLLDQAIRDHIEPKLDGHRQPIPRSTKLTDEHLRHCIELAAQGRPSPPQPRDELTDEHRLRKWSENDRLADEMRARPEGYFGGPALMSMYAKFRPRRFAEYPNLSARYYGSP